MVKQNDKVFAGGIASDDDRVTLWKQMVFAASKISGYRTSAEEVKKLAEDEHVTLSEDQLADILSANDESARNR